MRAVNYITEINQFRKFAFDNYVSSNAVLLWYGLFGINNDLRWPEWFKVDNLRLMGYAFIKREATLISARKELINLGLIEFKKGSKGHPSEYRIVMFAEKESKESTDNNMLNIDDTDDTNNTDNSQTQPQKAEQTTNNNTTASGERKQYKNAGYMFYYYKPQNKENDNTYKPKEYKTEYKPRARNRFNDFSQRIDIDIDALEKVLLE